MRLSRLLAVSIATGLLSGGLFGYPQFVDAGWSNDAAIWLSVIGFLGPFGASMSAYNTNTVTTAGRGCGCK